MKRLLFFTIFFFICLTVDIVWPQNTYQRYIWDGYRVIENPHYISPAERIAILEKKRREAAQRAQQKSTPPTPTISVGVKEAQAQQRRTTPRTPKDQQILQSPNRGSEVSQAEELEKRLRARRTAEAANLNDQCKIIQSRWKILRFEIDTLMLAHITLFGESVVFPSDELVGGLHIYCDTVSSLGSEWANSGEVKIETNKKMVDETAMIRSQLGLVTYVDLSPNAVHPIRILNFNNKAALYLSVAKQQEIATLIDMLLMQIEIIGRVAFPVAQAPPSSTPPTQ